MRAWSERTLLEFPSPSFASNLLQNDNPPIVECNDHLSTSVHLRSFNGSLYTYTNNCNTHGQIAEVQHPPGAVNSAPSKSVIASFAGQSFDYSCGLISVTAIPLVIERFPPFDLSEIYKQIRVLRDGGKDGISDRLHCLNELRSLHKSTYHPLDRVSHQL